MAEPFRTLNAKERMAIARQKMPEQDARARARAFTEVNLGFSEQLAMLEAQRCLQCKLAKCIDGCPVLVNVPEFIRHVAEGDLAAAAGSLFRDNTLPAVTGRVCPQETQCEAQCIRGLKGAPVAIGYLERYVADWARQQNNGIGNPAPASPSGKKAAVIGSGPAGLTAAGELAKFGHSVTVYEAFHTPGGVLVYGIPEFRLPKAIVRHEVERLEKSGVKIECNVIVGKTYSLDELRTMYDALFIANGAGLPVFMDVPGENLKGVYSANEYLTRVNLMAAYTTDAATPVLKGQRVAVVGGGNVAMDSVRTAKRLGAESATIVYRRSKVEMPARVEEVHHAEEEGILFELLVAPVEVRGTQDGWVSGLKCLRMELGEPDASGRRRPVPVKGSEFVIECDVVVVAIGTRANPLLTASSKELKLNKWGYIETDENGMTSIPGVFAGGDIVRGAATVILAMGDGKKAAQNMHKYLSGKI